VAIDPKGLNNIAPIAVGLTILLIHLFLVPLTGASVNPARSLGPALVSGTWANHWIYWIGPLIGGSLAGLVYEYVYMNRRD
jgi:glycerol uptake facilitator-like aquaporin